MQIYDITVPVGGTMRVNGRGAYLRYYAGSAVGGVDPSIIVKSGTSGTTVILAPGQAIRLPHGAPSVTEWQLLNYAGAGLITGQIVIGDGEITDNRINGSVSVASGTVNVAGSVAVTDAAKARAVAGGAYGGVSQYLTTGGNIPHFQVWNPPASGKNIFVERVSGVYAQFEVASSTAVLTASGIAPAPKKLGGAAGVALLYWQSAAGKVGNANPIFVSNGGDIYAPNTPILVPPGFGLIARGVTGVDNDFGMDWFEE